MWGWEAIAGGKTYARPLNVASLAFGSIVFGMLTEFGWRGVLHDGIAVAFAIAASGFLALALAERRNRKRSGTSSSTTPNADR